MGFFRPLLSCCAVLIALLGATLVAPVLAASSEWFEHEHGAVRLVAAGSVQADTGKVELGLQFRMKPGWKVYWRSPGDAGFPPHITWAGSENLADARIAWPAPKRFSVLGLQTLGYENEVVFPISGTVFEPGRDVSLKAKLRFLTCDDVCVPYQTTLDLAIPAGPDLVTPQAALIDLWRSRVPGPTADGGLAIDRVEGIKGEGGSVLLVRAVSAVPFQAPDLFVEGSEDLGFAKPETRFEGTSQEAFMRIAVSGSTDEPPTLVGSDLVLTLVDGDRAVERRVTVLERAFQPPPASAAAPDESPLAGFLLILALALAGGLILNVMPCVLPVLSIKLMSVIEHGGATPAGIRAGFVASAAGIIACFLVLGTVSVGLRAAGLAAGWGIQFQQPVFVVFMMVMVTLFACNMAGLFEFRLPGAISDAAAGAKTGPGLWGHFLTGVFTTLLATPCTAPFLGTSIGFALTRGPLEIYAVFLMLGIGLALPWLIVVLFPALVNRLPRPGNWMITVKRVLALALVGTAVWLLSVLWFQIGGPFSILVALIVAAIVFLLWQSKQIGGAHRLATWAFVAVLTVMSLVGVSSVTESEPQYEATASDARWGRFEKTAIADEIAAGNTVLVDVTADWCLTCQVNKSLVLDRGQIATLLEDRLVVGLRADWTRPDPAISEYLRLFNRFGIPFNVVYGPDAPHGVPLPEILTETAVLDGIRSAGGRAAQSLE